MNPDLRELYQEIIIDHNRNPRNHFEMQDANSKAQGFNPLCGDKLTLYLYCKDNIIQKISFVGSGCAISQASASLMTEFLKNKTLEEAHAFFKTFHHLMTSDDAQGWGQLEKLAVLEGVKAYPARVKCATLAWHTLEAALNYKHTPVSTE